MNKTNFKGFFPKDVKGSLDKYLYVKMYWGAIWSHFSVPFSIVSNLAGILVFLKIFGLWIPWLVFTIGIIMFFTLIWGGMMLYRKNIVQREININIRFHPPMQELLKNTKKDEGKE